jgi:hypothetical protein
MKPNLADILETCLQLMEKGASIDSVLLRYPNQAEELRPLLEAALQATSLGQQEAPVGALVRNRNRVLSTAARLSKKGGLITGWRSSWRFAWIALVGLIFLLVSGNGLLIASAHSLPGDILYPIKRSVETTQITIQSNPVQKQALQAAFSQRRIEETKSLMTIGRVEKVDFSGVIASKTSDGWLVSGIPVVVTSHTRVEGEIGVGDDVNVSGETHADGSVDASRLSPAMNNHGRNPDSTGSATDTEVPGETQSFDPSKAKPTGYHEGSDPNHPGGQNGSRGFQKTPAATGSHGFGPRGSVTPESPWGHDWNHH